MTRQTRRKLTIPVNSVRFYILFFLFFLSLLLWEPFLILKLCGNFLCFRRLFEYREGEPDLSAQKSEKQNNQT